jgi:hypothetical protein
VRVFMAMVSLSVMNIFWSRSVRRRRSCCSTRT